MDEEVLGSLLSDSAFADFVRSKVSAWLMSRLRLQNCLETLQLRRSHFGREIREIRLRLMELFPDQYTDDEIDEIFGELSETTGEDSDLSADSGGDKDIASKVASLDERKDRLEYLAELAFEREARILMNPNYLPTCGRIAGVSLVMSNELTLESKCMLVALWVRREYRDPSLLPLVHAQGEEASVPEQRILADLLYRHDHPKLDRTFGSDHRTQFESIKIILTEVRQAFNNHQSYLRGVSPQRPQSKDCPSQRKKPGRPPADPDTVQKEKQIADDWIQARKAGISKADFVKDRKPILKTLKDFERLLDRVSKRAKNPE